MHVQYIQCHVCASTVLVVFVRKGVRVSLPTGFLGISEGHQEQNGQKIGGFGASDVKYRV